LRSFVFRSKDKVWVWIAMNRETREIVASACGDRTENTCRILWDRVPSAYKETIVFSDYWSAYQAVIPSEQQRPAIIPNYCRLLARYHFKNHHYQHLEKPCYLVAPLYSTTSMMEPGTFGPTLVARIRALQYLHFFCLPDKNRPGRPESIIRLDRVFPTYLGRGLAPMDEKIHEEPFEILLSQFSMLSGSL